MRISKVLLASAGLALSLSACSSTPQYSTVATVTGNAPWTTQPPKPGAPNVVIKLDIKDVSTPEGQEPAYVGAGGVGAASLFSIKAGEKVEVDVNNQDSMPHTFTVDSLNLHATINPMATSSFTFVAKTAGTYSWYCEVPCGSWVMSNLGYMKGTFEVTA